MKKMILVASMVLCLSMLFAETSQAGLLVYEGFDIAGATPATLDTGDAGATSVGFSDTWTATPYGSNTNTTLSSGSLSGPDGYTLSTVGQKIDQVGGITLKRYFDTNGCIDLDQEGDEYWISFLAQKTYYAAGSYATLSIYLADIGGTVGTAANGFQMGFDSTSKAILSDVAGTDSLGSTALSGTSTYLFLAKIETHSADNGGTTDIDKYTLWTYEVGVDTVPTTAPSTGGMTIQNHAAVSSITLNRIAIASQTNTDGQFDEFRIGTDFASVVGTAVPEPSTITMLIAAGLALSLLRRRKK